jgi:hypothetical protein
MTTNQQYDAAIQQCREIFIKKTIDYGTSWRVLRPISVIDQIFIQAQRIRTIQQKGVNRVGEDVSSEFMAIVNYCAIGLIQLELGHDNYEELPGKQAEKLYNEKLAEARNVMLDKNHDYGEAFRDMSQESLDDLILMKLMRMRQIVANEGKTLISEGLDGNFYDIINYSAFALMLIEEGIHPS